jgi:hypothetical protein
MQSENQNYIQEDTGGPKIDFLKNCIDERFYWFEWNCIRQKVAISSVFDVTYSR